MNMARNLHGMHAPIKMAMEQSLVTKARGVSMLPQSNLGLDILLGKDESIDFEDFLNGMEMICCLSAGKCHMNQMVVKVALTLRDASCGYLFFFCCF